MCIRDRLLIPRGWLNVGRTKEELSCRLDSPDMIAKVVLGWVLLCVSHFLSRSTELSKNFLASLSLHLHTWEASSTSLQRGHLSVSENFHLFMHLLTPQMPAACFVTQFRLVGGRDMIPLSTASQSMLLVLLLGNLCRETQYRMADGA